MGNRKGIDMPWNHRVIRSKEQLSPELLAAGMDPEYYYGIHEVYYEKATEEGGSENYDNINGWTMGAIAPYGDTLEELQSTIKLMFKATRKPVLDLEELARRVGNRT